METLLKLPWPVSLNRLYRALHFRMVMSKAGREYKEKCVYYIRNSVMFKEGRYPLEVVLFAEKLYVPPEGVADPDIDNLDKVLHDSLEASRLIQNDSQIKADDRTICAPMGSGMVLVRLAPVPPGYMARRTEMLDWLIENEDLV